MDNAAITRPDSNFNGQAERREPTGVRGLDTVLGGGVPRGSLALVMGVPGSGKTTLASQMAPTQVRRRSS